MCNLGLNGHNSKITKNRYIDGIDIQTSDVNLFLYGRKRQSKSTITQHPPIKSKLSSTFNNP